MWSRSPERRRILRQVRLRHARPGSRAGRSISDQAARRARSRDFRVGPSSARSLPAEGPKAHGHGDAVCGPTQGGRPPRVGFQATPADRDFDGSRSSAEADTAENHDGNTAARAPPGIRSFVIERCPIRDIRRGRSGGTILAAGRAGDSQSPHQGQGQVRQRQRTVPDVEAPKECAPRACAVGRGSRRMACLSIPIAAWLALHQTADCRAVLVGSPTHPSRGSAEAAASVWGCSSPNRVKSSRTGIESSNASVKAPWGPFIAPSTFKSASPWR